MSNAQDQYQGAQNRLRILNDELYELQHELMKTVANSNPTRLDQSVQKARAVVDEIHAEYEATKVKYEKIENDFKKVQNKLEIAREQYTKVEQQQSKEKQGEQSDRERERKKIEDKVRRKKHEQAGVEIRLKNLQRDMELEQRRAANDAHAPSHRGYSGNSSTSANHRGRPSGLLR